MPFQRSYSKVWWGSEAQLPIMANDVGSSFLNGGFYTNLSQQHLSEQQPEQQPLGRHSGYHTLDISQMKAYAGNLSRILEVDDEQNASKLSWEKQNSPGSLRSQDSGFSDNEESHSAHSLSVRSSKTGSPSAKSNVSTQSTDSPTSNHSIATPPTVVRRVGRSEFYTPLVSVSRRISFSGTPSSSSAATKNTVDEASFECAELDDMQSLSSTPKKSDNHTKDSDQAKSNDQRRRRRVARKVTKPLTPTKRRTLGSTNAESDYSDDELRAAENSGLDVTDAASRTVPEYNNETVYLGEEPKPYNNETFVISRTDSENNAINTLLGGDFEVSPFKQHNGYTASTSTPKANSQHPAELPSYGSTIPQSFYTPHVYENPLLNGHSPALQSWLDDLRLSYDHEVMSTLQAKSISQEAFKNLTITTNTVTKLIRQLQQRALSTQSDFECLERILSGAQPATLQEALSSGMQLIANTGDFVKLLERRALFFAESRMDRKKFNDNIEQLKIIAKDTRYSLERQHYINLQSLLDDVQVLKRFLLITVRLVFEKMVRIIVQSIEHSNCDLMLRANINMIATLTNIDYEGFASLTDAFIQNEAVRTLLIVCLDHKLSSVRAMALRALATVCSSPEAITQFGACGGIEIVRDILLVKLEKQVGVIKRGELEQREAVSLLTQITAPWHGSGHHVDGLKDCVESLVEGLTQLLAHTSSCQTLLLCAAALNNLTRMEVTSHYSIMSNETIFKLIESLDEKDEGLTIFLYEQIVAMLYNMSLNKKCHSHLANGSIINFITSTYDVEFYKSYNSRAETDAQRRTIKMILHTLNRLAQNSSLGAELLQHQSFPICFKPTTTPSDGFANTNNTFIEVEAALQTPLDKSHKKAAESILHNASKDVDAENMEKTSLSAGGLKFNLSRQESYV